jgi:A/G-specific adenine glycosylase
MSFTTSVIEWYRENGRSLPWRETNDPYAIWLSEVILQQTRVEQGRPYWERFMQRWPTVESLADATEDEVLREWQGLGYYSRARNLHTAAKQIAAIGHFPNTMEELRRLKGIGDYTAAAIGSIAFGLPVAVVDGNVYRVLSRCFGISTPINTTEGKKEFAALAQSLLESLEFFAERSGRAERRVESLEFATAHEQGQIGAAATAAANSTLYTLNSTLYNQALMDFGALQCTPASPKCGTCPLVDSCCAFREGRVGELPVKLKKQKVKEIKMTYIYIRYKGETALRRRPAGDIWQGLYEPLSVECRTESVEFATAHEQGQTSAATTAAANSKLYTLHSQLIERSVRHVLTHRIIYADFYQWEPDERPALPEGYFWIPESDIDQYAVPRLVEKLLQKVKR